MLTFLKSSRSPITNSFPNLFLVPGSKEPVSALEKSWVNWGRKVFPGGRIAPPAIHAHIQLDGIPFAAVGSMDDLKRELQERNPLIGPVLGTPTWVNSPDSEAKIASKIAAGVRPRLAGSVFFRLESREKVDIAVAVMSVVNDY
ncbi:hypothetical protein B0H11DRAFT_1931454 [Mycena galericulata]|nr:hypothetical protein B0H11DRAFT_1931454 [Mycena galericulata]